MRRKCRRKGRGIVRDRGDVVQETEEGQCKRQKRGSARDSRMAEKGSCSARDKGVVVQEKEEGQCKRQSNGIAGKGEL
jgi:hypothetical protein